MNETKICRLCGKEKPIEDFSKSYKNLCKSCVAEHERLKRKLKNAFGVPEDMSNVPRMVMDMTDNPRFIPNPRFIASVAAMQGLLSATNLKIKPEVVAQAAVEHADALINELNKAKDENKD